MSIEQKGLVLKLCTFINDFFVVKTVQVSVVDLISIVTVILNYAPIWY